MRARDEDVLWWDRRASERTATAPGSVCPFPLNDSPRAHSQPESSLRRSREKNRTALVRRPSGRSRRFLHRRPERMGTTDVPIHASRRLATRVRRSVRQVRRRPSQAGRVPRIASIVWFRKLMPRQDGNCHVCAARCPSRPPQLYDTQAPGRDVMAVLDCT